MLYANKKQYAGIVFRYQHLFVVLFLERLSCGPSVAHALVARVWCVCVLRSLEMGSIN
jgi:hypothetical protein